jgi:hypothetical protein
MVMKRLLSVVATIVLAAGVGACDKPTAEDCRLAIVNMQKLLGTENLGKEGDIEGEIRRCKGGSTRESVACAIKATSLEDIKACNFRGAKK